MSQKKAVLLKVMLLGNASVGKTSVFQRFIKDQYSQTYKATIGADFFSKNLRVDDTDVVLQIWDTAGQERYQSLGVTFFRGSDVCILVYDICDQDSFEELNNWVLRFLEGVGASTDNPRDSGLIFAVLGNKCDLEEKRQVSNEFAKSFCEERGFLFFETSAKNGFQVFEAFSSIARIAAEKSASLPSQDLEYTGGINLDDDDDEAVFDANDSACGC